MLVVRTFFGFVIIFVVFTGTVSQSSELEQAVQSAVAVRPEHALLVQETKQLAQSLKRLRGF